MSAAEQEIPQDVQEAPEAKADALEGLVIESDEDQSPEETQQPEGEQPADEESQATEGKVEFTPEQQEFIERKIIASQVAKRKAAEEELARYRQEVETLRQQTGVQQDFNPETGEPIVPNMPDPFDADYDQKIAYRDQQLLARARWESQQELRYQEQLQTQQRQIEDLNTRTQSYVERGKDYGITADDIRKAGEFINSTGGLDPNLVDLVLDDDAGPAIPQYLYRNPEELQKVQSMTPARAAAYIATTIKPKAVRNAKRRVEPPPPISTERGMGSREQEGPPGVVYE